MEYVRHFHFFDEPSSIKDKSDNKISTVSGWLLDVSDFSALPGRGIRCFIDGKRVLVIFSIRCCYSLIIFTLGILLIGVIFTEQVGNRKLMAESGISIPTNVESFMVELEESAKTGILVAQDNNLIGVLGVADPLKREAAVVVEGLLKMGVIPVMVTGDNWRTARAVAREVCIFDLFMQ